MVLAARHLAKRLMKILTEREYSFTTTTTERKLYLSFVRLWLITAAFFLKKKKTYILRMRTLRSSPRVGTPSPTSHRGRLFVVSQRSHTLTVHPLKIQTGLGYPFVCASEEEMELDIYFARHSRSCALTEMLETMTRGKCHFQATLCHESQFGSSLFDLASGRTTSIVTDSGCGIFAHRRPYKAFRGIACVPRDRGR